MSLPRPAAALVLAFAVTIAAPAATLIVPAVALAQARDAEAENFVSSEANRALQILNDRSIGDGARKAAFRDFVDQAADVPRITGFVLGKYRRIITPAQYAEFAQTFRLYANSVYETRLGQYHGEKMRVTGSVVRQPGDVIVSTQVIGGQVKTPTEVKWRVLRGSDGRYRAVDVSIEGVWLAITEQQDFVSTLDNNRGDIGVLIGQLKTQTQNAARG